MSADDLVISVPCAACTTPILFGEQVCSSCRAIVSRAKQQVLERRLEAANPEFHALKANVSAASATLLMLAIGYLALGGILYYMAVDSTLIAPTPAELAAARFELMCNVFIAVVMGACFVWSRRNPSSALFTAAVLWFAVQVTIVSHAGFAALGLTELKTLVAKLVTLALLVRGIGSAMSASRLRAKLIPKRPGPST
jgi:hypothetical protein